ncbi:hypothetical protein [Bacillus massiliglaciei]|uniref:hypothetical protein n=1 Tax=Bacillus massiliglaciei TaxID=1816693 RepID=UPI000DA62A25|nr:hypothetical protein [Bacillus massiliglaciei]
MKFEILDQLIEQREAIETASAEMRQREIAAKEVYHAKLAEYEKVVTQGVIDGKDMTEALDRLDIEIQEAKAAVERRSKEYHIYSAVQPLAKISSEDVVKSFNSEIIQQFRTERFDAVLKRLLQAKKEYEQAVLDYKSAISEFEDVRTAARSELSDHYYYKLNDADLQTRQEHERYFITESDLFDLRGGQPLQSIQYVKPEEFK